MFKFFTKTYWRNRQKLRDLKTISTAVVAARDWQKRGLISWNPRERHLLVEQSLASIFLTKRDWWKSFCTMISYLAMDDRRKEVYEQAVLEAETKAVREAKKKSPILTPPDLMRIRQQARENMPQPKVDIIEEFDIFIIRAEATSSHSATEASGELVAIGHYNIDGQIDLAMWEDVKYNLSRK